MTNLLNGLYCRFDRTQYRNSELEDIRNYPSGSGDRKTMKGTLLTCVTISSNLCVYVCLF